MAEPIEIVLEGEYNYVEKERNYCTETFKLILSHEPLPMMPWVFNIHGHVHDRRHKNDDRHLNVCSDAINYSPVNLNKLMKNGLTSKIYSVHRQTIDVATKKKEKRKRNG